MYISKIHSDATILRLNFEHLVGRGGGVWEGVVLSPASQVCFCAVRPQSWAQLE